MQVPYSELEMRLALRDLDPSKFDEKAVEEIETEMRNEITDDKKELNKKIAEFHGISVETLVNSPNYKVLCGEHTIYVLKKFVEKATEKLGITDVQAWGLAAIGTGLIR